MHDEVRKIVSTLNLSPHPEGGYYRETYRSMGYIEKENLGDRHSGDRNFCTSIYFLLTSENFSAFHRIRQDEQWYFHKGAPLCVHVIDKKGEYCKHTISDLLVEKQEPQVTIEAGQWFAASVRDPDSYSLLSCTVSPGFDFDDFELADRRALIEEFPKHNILISKFTRA